MSKIAVICNTLNEYHTAKMGLGVTLRNAGKDFDLFLWDNGSDNDRIKYLLKEFEPKFLHYSEENVGNPVAYNQMLIRVKEQGYDYVMIIAPDQVLPPRWLELMYNVYQAGNLEGFLAFQANLHQQKTVEQVGEINGQPLYLEHCDYVFGCWFFSTKYLDVVGYINEKYKIYGKWDSDLNFRASAMGIRSYYLPVRKVTLNKAMGDSPKYREMKDKHLAHNEEVFKKEILRYAREGNYYIEPPKKMKL